MQRPSSRTGARALAQQSAEVQTKSTSYSLEPDVPDHPSNLVPRAAAKRRDPVLAEADRILSDWFEHQQPRPVLASWPESVRTVAKFLRAGNDATTLRQALELVPGVVSAGTVSIALERLLRPATQRGPSRDGTTAVLDGLAIELVEGLRGAV